MKHAQGLPITTIIIAALALIVLVVLIGIFGFRAQKFGEGVGEATKYQECPAGQDKNIADCNTPLVGNYGVKQLDGTVVAMPPGKVCCSS